MTTEEIVEMRKKLPCKMNVYNDNGIGERYVIDIFNNGSCRYVIGDYESNYKNGDFYCTSTASSCSPIPEKKRRLANRYEWIRWAMTEALDDARNGIVWVVSTIPSGKGSLVLYIDYSGDKEKYWRSKLDSEGNPTLWVRFWVEE